jgi:hypothetical protein
MKNEQRMEIDPLVYKHSNYKRPKINPDDEARRRTSTIVDKKKKKKSNE